MLHFSNNECMSTWVEWGSHILCGRCFGALLVKEPALHLSDFAELANSKPASSPADAASTQTQAPRSSR
jgi:hypothetical protein